MPPGGPGPGGHGPGGQGPGGPQGPWEQPAASPAPKKKGSTGLVIALAVVAVLALAGGGGSFYYYMENSRTTADLDAAHEEIESLGGQIDESDKEAEQREQEAQQAYEDADLPGLYDEVTTLSDDLESSMQDFAEASADEGASVDQIESLFQNMYDCLGAREEYNMGAAEHAGQLEADSENSHLPTYLSEDEYPCGRDFWGV